MASAQEQAPLQECVLVATASAEVQRLLCTQILEPAGHRVLAASDGREALRLALEAQPDLLVLDQHITGLTSLQVLQGLREAHSAIPVIFVSAHGSESLATQALRLGVRDCLIPPFGAEEMAESIERVLDEVRVRKERDRLIQQLEETNRQFQQQVRELDTLYSIGRSLTSLLDLETVLTRVVEAAVGLAQAEAGFLLLVEPGTGELMLRAARNVEEERARGLRVRVQDSLAGQVIQSGEPLLVASGQLKVATGFLVRSLIYAPLCTPDRGVIGILGVTSQQSDRSFTTHDVHLLSALANYASVAVENARLYQQTETERRKLKAVLLETEEAIIILDPQLNLTLCNPAASAALGIRTDQVGRPALEVISQTSLRELLQATRRAGRTLHAEVPTSAIEPTTPN